MRVFLIRHAKDDERYRGGWSGLDLTPSGIRQAQDLAAFLHQKQPQYKINKIISSDLLRAKHTADIINVKLNVALEYSKGWREINNGDLAGMLNSTCEIKYPHLYFGNLKMDERYPNGESPLEFYYRIKNAFDELCRNACGTDNVLLVTHGGVINIIYHLVTNTEWDNKKKSYSIPHGSIHLVEKDGDRYQIKSIDY